MCAEEGSNKFIYFFSVKKSKTLIDQRSATNITITESVLYKKTLDEFHTCDVNEVSLIVILIKIPRKHVI